MKITKYILLLLILFSVAFLVFVATQPNDYEISREKEISTSKENVFTYINDYTTWEDWFDLKEFDSSTKINYTTETSGTNSGFTWNSSTNNGKITTQNISLSDSIVQTFFIEENKHLIIWSFTSTKKGTLLKWTMKGKNTFKWKLKTILQSGIDNVYGGLFEKGILKIEKYLVTELETVKITIDGIVTKHTTNFIQQKDSCKIANYQFRSKQMLQNMITFVENNDIELKGLPFIMVDKQDEENETIIYSMCVPVEEEILTTEGSEISGNNFEEFLAFKTTLIGDYNHLKKARKKAIDAYTKLGYIKDDSNKYIEIYKTSLPKVKNPSQWVTELYFPIKKKIINPITTVSPTIEETVNEITE